MLSKVASSTIFWVFGMTQTGIEPRLTNGKLHVLKTTGAILKKIIISFIFISAEVNTS